MNEQNRERASGLILGILSGLVINLVVVMQWFDKIIHSIPQIGEFSYGPKGDMYIPFIFLTALAGEFFLARWGSQKFTKSEKILLAGVFTGISWSVILPAAFLCIGLLFSGA